MVVDLGAWKEYSDKCHDLLGVDLGHIYTGWQMSVSVLTNLHLQHIYNVCICPELFVVVTLLCQQDLSFLCPFHFELHLSFLE